MNKNYVSYLFSILFILSFLESFTQEFNYQKDFETILSRTNDSNDSLFHLELKQRFNRNDTTLSDFEVLALLINFTQNEFYQPYEILNNESKIENLVSEGEYDSAIRLCDSLLINHPYNQAILFEKALSHFAINQSDSSDFYRYKFNRILDAMAYSGKGTSTEDAIFSLGSMDSHSYIIRRLSQEIRQVGAGQDQQGNMIDIIETFKDGEGTRLMHFQIQHAVNRLLKSD